MGDETKKVAPDAVRSLPADAQQEGRGAANGAGRGVPDASGGLDASMLSLAAIGAMRHTVTPEALLEAVRVVSGLVTDWSGVVVWRRVKGEGEHDLLILPVGDLPAGDGWHWAAQFNDCPPLVAAWMEGFVAAMKVGGGQMRDHADMMGEPQ